MVQILVQRLQSQAVQKCVLPLRLARQANDFAIGSSADLQDGFAHSACSELRIGAGYWIGYSGSSVNVRHWGE